MRSYMFVFDQPYYEVTSTAGTFELKNLPPGTYTIEAWQEKYGTQDQTVTLGARESKTISFVFKADVRRAINGIGFEGVTFQHYSAAHNNLPLLFGM